MDVTLPPEEETFTSLYGEPHRFSQPRPDGLDVNCL